jgi:hypothetical protein
LAQATWPQNGVESIWQMSHCQLARQALVPNEVANLMVASNCLLLYTWLCSMTNV